MAHLWKYKFEIIATLTAITSLIVLTVTREGLLAGFVHVLLPVIGLASGFCLANIARQNWLGWFLSCLMLAPILWVGQIYATKNLAKHRVLKAHQPALKHMGRHIIIGYSQFEDVKALVELGAIGGIFVTRRNVAGRSFEDIKKEIESLKKIYSRHHLGPLIVTTDQEGGGVSRVSPPLVRMPTLATFQDLSNPNQIDHYATQKAQSLLSLGINLNFSPVVDLNPNRHNSLDLHTQIYKRAISDNPQVVTEVASRYVQVGEKYGLVSTLKHFPGLGRLRSDTHLFDVHLRGNLAEIAKTDWLPFRQIGSQSNAAIMLGHVYVPELDSRFVASTSKSVVNLIRYGWQHQGVLITDDLSMRPVYSGPGGIEGGALRALNAGVDLLLISYNHQSYYKVMDHILDALDSGRLSRQSIEASRQRLQKMFEVMDRSHRPQSAATW